MAYRRSSPTGGRAAPQLVILEAAVHQALVDSQAEVRRLREELQAARQQLEGAGASVSHELITPLRHILGFADLLRNDPDSQLGVAGLKHLNTISGATKRMAEVVQQLLTFASIGANPLQKSRVCLDQLLRESLHEFRSDTHNRKILWVVQPLPTVWADRLHIRLVLDNLISNALKFTGRRDPARIEIGCCPTTTRETVVFVGDNGAGFDPRHGRKLFQLFQRLHRRADFAGSGVGLANVRGVVERHGGRTWAEGRTEQGATFYFTLPLGPDEDE